MDIMLNGDDTLRGAAADSLGKELGLPAAERRISVLDNETGIYDNGHRFYSAKALAEIDDKSVKERLDQAFFTEGPYHRRGGGELLHQEGEEGTEEVLIWPCTSTAAKTWRRYTSTAATHSLKARARIGGASTATRSAKDSAARASPGDDDACSRINTAL
jgi:hypothetical protein